MGPSACIRADGVEVGELSKEMIDRIVSSYGHCAALAKRAGFEMIMIHAGHGWLINQFLSPMFNHRTDEYGGSLENRCRFAKEILHMARAYPYRHLLVRAQFFRHHRGKSLAGADFQPLHAQNKLLRIQLGQSL